MMEDKILKDTIRYMQQRFIKGMYRHRKSDYELYLHKLKQFNHGKKNNIKEKSTS